MTSIALNFENCCKEVIAMSLTCSALLMHVGRSGITGNMYSRGYNMATNAITLIDKAL
jgi:hypothetical protein